MASHRARGPWRSLIALVLALSASGAVGLALDGLKHPVHHCRCRHGPDEDCDCPSCQRALVAAMDDSRLPPCHRAAARARLARSSKPSTRDCIKGSCGREDEGTPRPPQPEPVVLSSAPRLRRVPRPQPTALLASVAGRDAERPATPPPRAS